MNRDRLALIVVFVIVLVDSIGFGIILPVMPDLLMAVSSISIGAAEPATPGSP